jgi:putative hydrolase of the HAD superfamily
MPEARPEISTVLLDAGGVILDESEDEQSRVAVALDVLSAIIPGYSREDLYSDLDEAIRGLCPRVLAYVFWKHVKPDLDTFDRLYAEFITRWRPDRPALRVMPGFRQEAEEMAARWRLGIAGQYGRELLDLLRRESLIDLFTYRFTQDDFDITKPDPRYLERIAQACGVRPVECLMVGDRIDNDIIPARQLGMRTVLVRVGLHRNQQPRIPSEMPDAEIGGVKGLAAAVQNAARSQ